MTSLTCIASCPSTSLPGMFCWRFTNYTFKATIIILSANRKDALTQTSKLVLSLLSHVPASLCRSLGLEFMKDGSCCCCLRDYHVNLWVCNHVVCYSARARTCARAHIYICMVFCDVTHVGSDRARARAYAHAHNVCHAWPVLASSPAPGPFPAFQCYTLKSGRAWYAKSRA